MNYRDIDIFGYSFGGEVLKRIAELGDDVREAYNRLVQAGYPSSTAEKIATGELPMDSASKAARMQEQGYTTPAFSGSTFDIREFKTSGANPESDFGRGTYATTSPLDATANYAGVGPDLTQRIELRAERLADYADDEYSLAEMLDEVGLTLDDYYADEAAALEKVARAQLLGDAPGGVTYPLRINTQNYAVIGGDNPTVLTDTRDYLEEAKQALGAAADEDDIFDYAEDLRFNDDEGLYARIREALSETDIYQDEQAINSVLEEIAGDIAEGDVRIADIDAAIRRNVSEAYDDATGDLLSSGEISRQTIQNLGFEGVIDNTVDLKFGTNRRGVLGRTKVPGMTGVTPDTSHIITFPGQEKNIRSQFAAFDPDQIDSPNILAGLAPYAVPTVLGGSLLGAAMAPQKAEASALGEIAKRLVRNTSDASNIFGEGAEQITLSDPVSGGRIKLLSRPGEPNSVLSLYVDEEFRGQGVGKALQDAALAEGPLMGQVSSKAAAVNAYRSGRRPIGNPNASLEDVFAAIDEDSSVNMVTSDLLPSGKSALGAGAIGTAALAAPQDALAAEQGGAMDEIDIFEQFSQLSPEAEALLSRSAEGMVMTPGGPVRADAGPTEAQALNFAGLMTGLGGVVDIFGEYPQMPAEGVSVEEMLAGETNPSLLENLREGEYLEAGLQALGAIPLVGAAAKAPRMLSRAELAEFKNVLTQAIERQDPNLRQLIDEHPTVVAAQARLSEIPETVDNPLYNTEEWVQNRQFIFGSGDNARVVTGYDEGVDELYEQSKRLAWEDDNIPYPGPMKTEGPKTAVIVLGPPASGKSSISNPIARKLNATIIDSDEAKKLLPEYEGGVGANAVHQESKAIAQLLEQAAIKEGDNLVIPTVGDNAEKIRARISALRDAGYNVQLVDVVVPAEEAAIRMYNRFAGTGRIIPASYIRSVGDNPTQTYNLLREEGIADGYTRIDNSGAFEQPKPVREDTGELLQGTELRLQFEGGSGGNGRSVSRDAGRASAGAGASSEAKRGIGSLNLD